MIRIIEMLKGDIKDRITSKAYFISRRNDQRQNYLQSLLYFQTKSSEPTLFPDEMIRDSETISSTSNDLESFSSC